MTDRATAEALADQALGVAIRDRCNAMLEEGFSLEQVVVWAKVHGPDFHLIRERAIALAMGDQPVVTCSCKSHKRS